MKLTKEEVQEIVFSDHKDFDTVEEIDGEDRRWSRTNEVITLHKPTGKLYRVYWEQGLTEMQEHEYEAQDAVEVRRVTKTVQVTTFEEVNND
jgi:hypothetical protein